MARVDNWFVVDIERSATVCVSRAGEADRDWKSKWSSDANWCLFGPREIVVVAGRPRFNVSRPGAFGIASNCLKGTGRNVSCIKTKQEVEGIGQRENGSWGSGFKELDLGVHDRPRRGSSRPGATVARSWKEEAEEKQKSEIGRILKEKSSRKLKNNKIKKRTKCQGTKLHLDSRVAALRLGG